MLKSQKKKKKYMDFNFNKISFSINHNSDLRAIDISNDFRSFKIINQDKRFKSIILPIRDGISISRLI